LTRQPGDLERFLDTCERRNVSLASVTEPFDVGTNSGLFMLRQFVGFASYESGVKSERIARKHLELADRGLPVVGMTGLHTIFGDVVRPELHREAHLGGLVSGHLSSLAVSVRQ
jgi:DNA invertase Pin-like site-specific DNA recombinase